MKYVFSKQTAVSEWCFYRKLDSQHLSSLAPSCFTVSNTVHVQFADISLQDFLYVTSQFSKTSRSYVELPAATKWPRAAFKEQEVTCQFCCRSATWVFSNRSLQTLFHAFGSASKSPRLARSLNVPGLHDAGLNMPIVWLHPINMPTCGSLFDRNIKQLIIHHFTISGLVFVL